MRFFCIKVLILNCTRRRICCPTNFIFCTATKEAEIAIPSFTEFMMNTYAPFMTCFRFQIAISICAIKELVRCRGQEIFFIRCIYIRFSIHIVANANGWRCMCTKCRMVVNTNTWCYRPFWSHFPLILKEIRRIRKLDTTHVNNLILAPIKTANYGMVFRFICHLIAKRTSLNIC